MNIHRIYELLEKQSNERHYFYTLCLKLHAVVEFKGLRMIMENPWHEINYTNYFWFRKVTFVDKDRTMRGDYFKKPTGYWFTNCEPTSGTSFQPTPKEKVKRVGMTQAYRDKQKGVVYETAKSSSKRGLCSEERSMISPDYARNFICDFILGKEQKHTQLTLF